MDTQRDKWQQKSVILVLGRIKKHRVVLHDMITHKVDCRCVNTDVTMCKFHVSIVAAGAVALICKNRHQGGHKVPERTTKMFAITS